MIWLYVAFGTYSKVYYTINTFIFKKKPPTAAIPDLVTHCPSLKLKRRKNYAAEENNSDAAGGVVEADVLPNCYYPGWAAVMHTLYSFSQTSKYQFLEDGRVLSVSNYSAASRRSYELSRTQCVSVEEESEDHIKMVAVTLAGCEERFKCVRLFRRTDSIVEIQVRFAQDCFTVVQ
jgi:hypothetical protein